MIGIESTHSQALWSHYTIYCKACHENSCHITTCAYAQYSNRPYYRIIFKITQQLPHEFISSNHESHMLYHVSIPHYSFHQNNA